MKEEDAITMQEGKHGMKKLSMLDTWYSTMFHIFSFPLDNPLKNATNVHTIIFMSARLGLVHVCLKLPC